MAEGGSVLDPENELVFSDDTVPTSKDHSSQAAVSMSSSPVVTRSKSKAGSNAPSNGDKENAIGANSKILNMNEPATSKTTQVKPKMLGRKPPKPKKTLDECNNVTPPRSKAPKKKRTPKLTKPVADEGAGAASDETMHGIEDITLDGPPTVRRRPSPRAILSPIPYSSASSNNPSQAAHTSGDSVGIFIPYNVDAQVTVGIKNGVITLNAGPPPSTDTPEQPPEEKKKREYRRKEAKKHKAKESRKPDKGMKKTKLRQRKKNEGRRQRSDSSEDSSEDYCTCSCACATSDSTSSCSSDCSTFDSDSGSGSSDGHRCRCHECH